MKQGDKISCPACHNQTVVKEKVEMDGWTVIDKIFVCAFCGVRLGSAADAESDEQYAAKRPFPDWRLYLKRNWKKFR